MPDALLPVKERIVLDVVSTIETITTANGLYAYTLTVERPNPCSGNASKDNGVVVVQGDPQRINDGDDDANGFDEWHLPVSVVCTVFESETSQATIDTRLNIIEADVIKVLTAEGSHTRGNLAHGRGTWIHAVEQAETPFDANQGQIALHFFVHYRHLTGDPYSQS